ncbi:hypothetical protein HDU97_000429 [Phlyctochytrium planicorne]|nr:hypothetical protein HDU97_000429 [Phlyctochytrium planicorne]
MRFTFKRSHPAVISPLGSHEDGSPAGSDRGSLLKQSKSSLIDPLDAATLAELGNSQTTLTDQSEAIEKSQDIPESDNTTSPPSLNNAATTPSAAAAVWVMRPAVGTSGRAGSGSPTKSSATNLNIQISLGVAIAAEAGSGNPSLPTRQPPLHVVSTVLPKGSGLGIPSPTTASTAPRTERIAAPVPPADGTQPTPPSKAPQTSDVFPSLPKQGRYVVVRPVASAEPPILDSNLVATPPSTLPKTASSNPPLEPITSKIDAINRRWNEMMDKTSAKSDAPGIYAAPGEITPEPSADPQPTSAEKERKKARNISFNEKVMYRTVSIVTLEKPQQNIMVLRPDGTVDHNVRDFWSDDEDDDESTEGSERDIHYDSLDSVLQMDEISTPNYEDSAIDLISQQSESDGSGKKGFSEGQGKESGDEWALPPSHSYSHSRYRKVQSGSTNPPGYVKSPSQPRHVFKTGAPGSGYISSRNVNSASDLSAHERLLENALPRKKSGQKQVSPQMTPNGGFTIDPVTPFSQQPTTLSSVSISQSAAPRRGPSITAPMILRNQSHSAPLHRESLRSEWGDNVAYWRDYEEEHTEVSENSNKNLLDGQHKVKMPRDVFTEHGFQTNHSFVSRQPHPHSAPPLADSGKIFSHNEHMEKLKAFDERLLATASAGHANNNTQSSPSSLKVLGHASVLEKQEPSMGYTKSRPLSITPPKVPTHDAWTGPALVSGASSSEKEDRQHSLVPTPPTVGMSAKNGSPRRTIQTSGLRSADPAVPVPVVVVKIAKPQSALKSTLSDSNRAEFTKDANAEAKASENDSEGVSAPLDTQHANNTSPKKAHPSDDLPLAPQSTESTLTKPNSETLNSTQNPTDDTMERRQEPPATTTLQKRKSNSMSSMPSLSNLFHSGKASSDSLSKSIHIETRPVSRAKSASNQAEQLATSELAEKRQGSVGALDECLSRKTLSRTPSARTSRWSRTQPSQASSSPKKSLYGFLLGVKVKIVDFFKRSRTHSRQKLKVEPQ